VDRGAEWSLDGVDRGTPVRGPDREAWKRGIGEWKWGRSRAWQIRERWACEVWLACCADESSSRSDMPTGAVRWKMPKERQTGCVATCLADYAASCTEIFPISSLHLGARCFVRTRAVLLKNQAVEDGCTTSIAQ